MNMKRVLCAALGIVFVFQAHCQASGPEKLRNLYNTKRYFELRDELRKVKDDSHPEVIFFRAVVYNKFNSLDSSINYINRYLKLTESDKADTLKEESYDILADNYIKSYDYSSAAAAYNRILKDFSATLDSEETADMKNSAKLFASVSKVPRQITSVLKDTKLNIKKDKAGLSNLKVVVGRDSVDFIFDTGANLSVVSYSTALQMGMKLFDDSIDVDAITGNKVRGRLGFLPVMRIGGIEVRNAIFLVFDDKDLSFPQIGYKINGIIGFPVIESFGEVTISRSGIFSVPVNASRRGGQNMCLNDLTPLVEAVHRNKRMIFTFDTGAKSSFLNYLFFKTFEDEVRAGGSEESAELGGAGGMKSFSIYKFKNFEMNIAGRRASLPEVTVLTAPVSSGNRFFYGNLGQDIIGQFESMTLNFLTMSLIFE